MAAHNITASQALQVLNNGARFGRNRKHRRAAYLMIGRDDGGACIAIPLEPTRERSVWRPVTAWYCKRYELDWLPR